MNWRILGAVLLIAGSCGIGSRIAAVYKQETIQLYQIRKTIEYIICDLQWLQNPLPQIIHNTFPYATGNLKQLLREYALQLEAQVTPNPACCMEAAIRRFPEISDSARRYLIELGESLGKFNLQGQLLCIQGINMKCINELRELEEKLPVHTRCCRAYSLCIGIILTLILF